MISEGLKRRNLERYIKNIRLDLRQSPIMLNYLRARLNKYNYLYVYKLFQLLKKVIYFKFSTRAERAILFPIFKIYIINNISFSSFLVLSILRLN